MGELKGEFDGYLEIYKILEPMRSRRNRDGMMVSMEAENKVIADLQALVRHREAAAVRATLDKYTHMRQSANTWANIHRAMEAEMAELEATGGGE